MFTTERLIVVVRFIVAAVFLVSGVAKLFSPQPAAAFVADMFSLSSNTSLALVLLLSVCEAAIGLGLLVGFKLQVVSFTASLFLLGAFVVGLHVLGEEKTCGCFGGLIASKTDETFVLRTLGFLVLSLIVLKSSSSHASQNKEVSGES